MNNKLIFVVFSILLIFVGSSAAAGSTLRIENGTSKANDIITVNVTALNVLDLSNFDITLSYDPSVVNVTNANNNPAFSTSLNNLEQASNGIIRLITLNTGSGQSGDVLLSTLTLKAVGTPGQKSNLNLIVNTFVNSAEAEIPAGVENGTFNISGSTLKSIMISPSATTTLTAGGSQLFSATAVDQDGIPMEGINVAWTSSNMTVGTVSPESVMTDANGTATTTFTAIANGTATVTATNGSVKGNATVTVSVVVEQNLTTITVSPPSISLTVGDTRTFTASPKDQDGVAFPATVTWTSNNTTVGIVDDSGNFTALAPGTSMVNATNGSVTGTAIVTVAISIVDIISPVTTISGVTENGSFNNSVTVSLNATDNTGGSGVNETFYMVNGGPTTTYSAPFVVNTIGQDNVTYWSTDKAGNVEPQNMVNFTIGNIPEVNATATREIGRKSILPGESTNITVRIAGITKATGLHEIPPQGWNVTRGSDNADGFKNNTNEWVWISSEANKTVTYTMTAPLNISIGTYQIEGTIRDINGTLANVGGDNSIKIDILEVYRRLGDDPAVVETGDLLSAFDDFRNNRAPKPFDRALNAQEVSELINEWINS